MYMRNIRKQVLPTTAESQLLEAHKEAAIQQVMITNLRKQSHVSIISEVLASLFNFSA